MEMDIIKKVFPAEGAEGMKAQRQESKGHVFRKQGEPRLDRTRRGIREAGIRKRGALWEE